MSAKKTNSSRKRSRPVEKQSTSKKLKRNKPAMFLAIFIVFILVTSSAFAIFQFLGGNSFQPQQEISYQDDPEYQESLAGTSYPVAVIETSKGAIAIELYTDQAPYTCQNFINLVNDGFYDGMIFHRISDDFMIQAGKSFPDGSTKSSPYGNIPEFEGGISHLDGTISMASTDAGVPGSAEFFICDKAQSFLDGNYAAFGRTIYGIDVVRDIADDDHDASLEPSPGGGKPINDIVINKIIMVKE